MARPLGVSSIFMKAPPPELALQAAQFALTEDGFHLVASDPLAAIKDLPKNLYDVVTTRNGCVYCHGLRGIGARSHHTAALTGSAHGGEAIPLEAYPLEDWRNFVFDQLSVAKRIGASPNLVAEGARQSLCDLVKQSRTATDKK